jgi:hypothetical protein
MTKKILLVLALLLPLAAACSDDDGGDVTGSASASGSGSGSASGSGSGSASHASSEECEIVGGTDAEHDAEVHVTLKEWSIGLDENTVAAGNVKFEAMNDGEEDHELVIIKGAKPGALKVGDEGLDEAALPAGAEVLGEIEGFGSGKECAGTFELAAGDYTLICNIVEEHEDHVHVKLGMITPFTVS